MNRRSFTKSLAALATLPALPLRALTPAASAAVAVPSQARFWAIYMSGLHGQVTPRALQVMLNVSHTQAQSYITELVAQGVIKPNPFASLGKQAVTGDKPDFVERLKERFKKKAEAAMEDPAEDLAQVEEAVEDPDQPDQIADETVDETEETQKEVST